MKTGRKMENIERIGRIHTEGWMKLMKQRLGIIRKLNDKNRNNMDTVTLVVFIFVICGYVWLSYSIGKIAEYLAGFNRYIVFVLSLVFTPVLVLVVVIIVDDIRMSRYEDKR